MSKSDHDSGDLIAGLLERAFDSGPAREANQLIHDMRQRLGARSLNYEVVLLSPTGEQRGWDYLEQIVLPRLAHLAHSKRMSVRSPLIFVSLFAGDQLYFVEAAELFDHYREANGLDEASFDALLSLWQRTGQHTVSTS